MGICSSCEATAVATAKLILPDGTLQEFPYPIRVSNVIRNLNLSSIFICNSDDMEFDEVVSPLPDTDFLRLGQLYFALPIARLTVPFQPQEMAALAVKATAALNKSGGKNKAWFPLETGGNGGTKSSGRVVDVGISGSGSGKSGMGKSFTAMLSSIPE